MNPQQATPVCTLDRDEGPGPEALPQACADETSGCGAVGRETAVGEPVGSETVPAGGSDCGNAPSSRAGPAAGTGLCSGAGPSSGRRPVTTLDRLRAGEECSVVGLRVPGGPHGARAGTDAVAQRLSELGFVEGTRLRVVRFAPLGDPMEVEIRGYHLSLRRSEASLVEVEREPSLRAACSPD